MAERSGIGHRFSHMRPGDLEAGEVDSGGFFQRGAFPGTGARMAAYGAQAIKLAVRAVERLRPEGVTHLIVASCTGFTAPGLDLQLAARIGLPATVARTMIGFMGCSAAVPALRAADHTVRAEPGARVLVINIELCSLHLQETDDVETALSLMLFGDGCSAALVTADPVGIALGDFRSVILPDSAGLITWTIGDQGFLMHLSGQVPGRIAGALRRDVAEGDPAGLLRGEQADSYLHWAVHGGGRTVLDAVEIGLALPQDALRHSRLVLQAFGNMSSCTIMYVLARMLAEGAEGPGMAMAFGPGMVAETFRFALGARRSFEVELMDRPETSRADYARALRELARVNQVTFTHRPILAWLDAVTADLPRGARVSVLDIASGQGDLLRAIKVWGRARGLRLVLEGLDLNPQSAVEAEAATPPLMGIVWTTGDVFSHVPDPAPDFIVSSQFTHHLDDAEVVAFLRWVERYSQRGWLIADLHRHWIPYYGFRLLCWVLGFHRIVRIDGTISIARSFRRADWQRLLAQAGIQAEMSRVVVAGGGIAGAAAACLLARDGVEVTVLERSLGPTDKICGEFLSAEAQHYLGGLGLDALALGGHPITRVRLVKGGSVAQAALPFRGLGLSRYVLDEALLDHAERCGAAVMRGVVVGEITPEMRFLATGKHEFRAARRDLDTAPERLVGFKMYWRLTPVQRAALSGVVEVILFRGGYAGLQMVEGGRANLCLLVHRDRLADAGGVWSGLLEHLTAECSHLRTRLEGAEPLLARPLTISSVPYGFMHRPAAGETLFRLGDQACVIPSFSGDGMSMALHSAALAVRTHRSGGSPRQYHARLRQDVKGPIRRAMALYRLGRFGPGQRVLVQALRLWPDLMRRAAEGTRVARPAWIFD
eukprot:gene6008-6080_t